jgi:hypothetical protein
MLLSVNGLPNESHFLLWQLGNNTEKRAGTELSGILQVINSGYLVLSVPTSLVRGVFDAMVEPGISLPSAIDGLRACIIVMTPEELNSIGGANNVSERGKAFHYQLGDLVESAAKAWPGVSTCWHLRIKSPELTKLRRSYGLPDKLEDQSDFSIVVACRKVGVLAANAKSKVDYIDPSILPDWTKPN